MPNWIAGYIHSMIHYDAQCNWLAREDNTTDARTRRSNSAFLIAVQFIYCGRLAAM